MKTVFNTEAFIRNVSASFGWYLFVSGTVWVHCENEEKKQLRREQNSKHDLIVLRILSYQERKSTAAKAQVLIRFIKPSHLPTCQLESTLIYFASLWGHLGHGFLGHPAKLGESRFAHFVFLGFTVGLRFFARCFLPELSRSTVAKEGLNWIAESLPQIQGKQFGMCRVSR